MSARARHPGQSNPPDCPSAIRATGLVVAPVIGLPKGYDKISPIQGTELCYVFRTARGAVPICVSRQIWTKPAACARHAARYLFPTRIPPLGVCEPNEVTQMRAARVDHAPWRRGGRVAVRGARTATGKSALYWCAGVCVASAARRAKLRAATGGEDWASALRTVARRSFVLEEAPNGFGRLKIVVQSSNQRLHQWHSGSQAGNAVSTAVYSVQHDRSTGGAGRPIRDSDARVGVGIRMRQLSALDRLRAAIHFS